MMAWYDMSWRDNDDDDDDDDDKINNWRRRTQFLLAEATPVIPHDVDDMLSLHGVRTCMLWSRDVTDVGGWWTRQSSGGGSYRLDLLCF